MSASFAHVGLRAPERVISLAFLPPLILFGTVVFNAVLALLNAQVAPVPRAAVVACEVALVAGVFVVALLNFRDEMRPWYALIFLMALIFAFRCVAMGSVEPKDFRDVLLIPTFVLLGMCMRWPVLLRTVLVIHAVVVAVMMLEALATDTFAQLFDIRGYYIQTRGLSSEAFWNSESNLFVSATRPADRIFLPFLNLHRTSSVFLEPVSLGNYCVVLAGFVCATYNRLSATERWFLIAGTLVLIVGCDGRLAFLSALVILAVSPLAPHLPRYSTLFYLPLVLLGAFLAVSWGGLRAGIDDLPGRIAYTVVLLQDLGVEDYAGISRAFLSQAVDSGVAYLVLTQSVLGLAILWLFIVFGSRAETPEQLRYDHILCLYIGFNLLVSFSFLSLKTAALLWAIHGVLQTTSFADRLSRPKSLARRRGFAR